MASGAAYGLAVVAYPTLLFIVAFFAVFFVFAHGRRVVAVVAEGAFDHPPDPPGPPTGITAWRSLSAWVAGGALVLVPVAFILLSFGWRNIKASVRASIVGGRAIQQLGGAPKAIAVARSSWAFVTMHPLVLVAAVAVYLVYRRWPERGRALLVLLPLVLWLGSRDDLLQASGFVGAYMLLAVYLFLFLPRHERDAGAKLLIWVWAPAVLAGAMTAFTSGNGLENAAVGVAPTLMVGGLFLAWALEAAGRPAAARPPDALESAAGDSAASEPGGAEAATDAGGALAAPRPGRLSWLAMAALLAVLALTIVFQFQFQQGGLPYSSLTSRFDSGPWWGIKVTPGQRAQADGFARDLRAQTRPGDQLLVFYGGSGYYLYWSGGIASNAYGLMPEGDPARAPAGDVRLLPRASGRARGGRPPGAAGGPESRPGRDRERGPGLSRDAGAPFLRLLPQAAGREHAGGARRPPATLSDRPRAGRPAGPARRAGRRETRRPVCRRRAPLRYAGGDGASCGPARGSSP